MANQLVLFRTSLAAAMALGLAACGGGEEENPPVSGAVIESFTANKTTVFPGETVTLSWKVTKASKISITAEPGGAVNVPETQFEGSVTSAAINANTTFRLTATDAASKSVSKTVSVSIDMSGPQVTSFTANPTTGAIGDTVTLSWTTANATAVEILDGANAIFNSTTMVASGSTQVTISMSSHVYTLKATSGTAMDTETVTVTTNTPAEIIAFDANPRAYTGASAMITLTWDARGQLSLTANATPVAGFPGGDMGTMQVTVTQATEFILTAMGGGATVTRTVLVSQAVAEMEPNNDSGTATPIGAGGAVTAALDPGSDVDFFAVMVPAGGWVEAETSDGGSGCNLDTILRLYDTDGTTQLGSDDEGGAPGPGNGGCSRIDPVDDDFAASLTGGTYYLSVSSFMGSEMGAYVLSVRTGMAGCGNGIIEGSEQCDDGNTSAGDACSPTCQIEVDGMITGNGGQVVVTVGDEAAAPRLISITLSTAGQSITATTSDGAGNCPLDTSLRLYEPDGSLLGVRGGGPNCGDIDPRRDRFAANLEPGTYFLAVENEGTGAGGQVTVDVTIVSPACGNGISETRANEVCDDGNTMTGDGCSPTCQPEPLGTVNGIGQEQTFSGAIDPAGQADFYEIVMPSAGYIRAETGVPTFGMCDGNPRDTKIYLLDSAYAELANDDDGGMGLCSLIDPGADTGASVQAGTYYIKVTAFSATAVIAAYQVKINTSGPGCGNGIREGAEECDDGNTTANDGCDANCAFEGNVQNEMEPNGDTMSATPTNATIGGGPVVMVGSIMPQMMMADYDVYAVTVPAGMTAKLKAVTHTTFGNEASCSMADTEIDILDSAGMQVANDDDDGEGLCSLIDGTDTMSPDMADMYAAALAAGTYYVKVYYFNGSATGTINQYFLTITLSM